MLNNNFIGWKTVLSAMEQVQKVSPWLSRQIAQRASEWPFWFSGLQIDEWVDHRVRVSLPFSRRNSVDGELCQGHVLLGAELTLRLLILRFRQEFPFAYRMVASRLEVHNRLDQGLEYRFEVSVPDWENVRIEMARHEVTHSEFVLPAYLADGRLAATVTFRLAFQLEKLLPA